MQPTDSNEKIHMGHNVKRFREMLGIKQEALAFELGDDWNQKKISLIEQKETIDDGLLEEISKVLKIPVEAFKNFNEEKAIYNIQNNYEGSNTGAANINTNNNSCVVKYEGKWIESMEKIKDLYEKLVASEREKVEILQKILDKK